MKATELIKFFQNMIDLEGSDLDVVYCTRLGKEEMPIKQLGISSNKIILSSTEE